MKRRGLLLSGPGLPLTARHAGAEAVDPTPMGPEPFGNHTQAEVTRWTALAKERKIQVED